MNTSAVYAAFAAAVLACNPASASVQAPVPKASVADLRVRKVSYQPDTVTVVSARPDFETMISFAEGERIENVAVGDSTSWQVAPNKHSDLLFVKPITIDAHTNMAVVTDLRTYLFELRADDAAGPMMYSLRFVYPPSAAPKPTTLPAAITTDWQSSGNASLRPQRAYDDGRSVFMYWPKENALPAVLAVDEKGNEEPLTFSARDDYLITESVPSRIILRVGNNQAVLSPRAGARGRASQIAAR